MREVNKDYYKSDLANLIRESYEKHALYRIQLLYSSCICSACCKIRTTLKRLDSNLSAEYTIIPELVNHLFTKEDQKQLLKKLRRYTREKFSSNLFS